MLLNIFLEVYLLGAVANPLPYYSST